MMHWEHLKDNTPEDMWITGNVLMMQKTMEKIGSEVYNMQKEIGPNGCPVCFVGNELLEDVIKEINAMDLKKGQETIPRKPSVKGTPIYDFRQVFKSLFLGHSKEYTRTVLSTLRGIFKSKATSKTFVYFLLHGAATTWTLQCELNMPEPTVYQTLKNLHDIEIIAPAEKMSKVKRRKGGPRPILWALDGATTEEVNEARRLHYKLRAKGGKKNEL